LLTPKTKDGGGGFAGEGFNLKKSGDARVVYGVSFVGKSRLLKI
jgi:ribosome-interacting GTPase 1